MKREQVMHLLKSTWDSPNSHRKWAAVGRDEREPRTGAARTCWWLVIPWVGLGVLALRRVCPDITGKGGYRVAGQSMDPSLAFSDTARWECADALLKWKSRCALSLCWHGLGLDHSCLFRSMMFGRNRRATV